MIKAPNERILVRVEQQTGERRVGALFIAATADNNAITTGVVVDVGTWLSDWGTINEGDRVWFNKFTAAEIDHGHEGKLYSITDKDVLAYEPSEQQREG